MRVAFVLPQYLRLPCGGFKVVYEIANRLAARGHDVHVTHPRSLTRARGIGQRLRAETWPARTRWRRRPLVSWFPFHERVSVDLVPDLRPRWLPNADALVATAWETAAALAHHPPEKGHKHIFVQDFEHWITASPGQRDTIRQALDGPFRRIASSPAVRDLLVSLDLAPSATVHPGYRPSVYHVERGVEERDDVTIGFPMRTEHFKGSRDAIAAFDLLRRDERPWRIRAFGVLPEPDMPGWIDYCHVPTDDELCGFYNSLAVFVLPSHFEGWGITGVEAMACGAALVAADSVGVRPYARDLETAMVVPPGRPDLLAAAIRRLIDDHGLRTRLATTAAGAATAYRWEPVVDTVEEVLSA